MFLRRYSNTLNLLTQASTVFKSYHCGYHSDIQRRVQNNFDPAGDQAQQFPLVLWAAPTQGQVSDFALNKGTLQTEIELYFYDLQGYDASGDATPETMLSAWDRLHSAALEMLHAFKGSVREGVEDVRWFTDANLHTDRLLCVGVTFKVSEKYGCDDYQGETPLLALTTPAPDSVDLETEEAP